MTHEKNLCKVKTVDLAFEEVIGEVTKQLIAKGVIDLKDLRKPPAKQILDVVATVTITRQRVVNEKVIFDGEVRVKVIYEADREDQPVFVAEIVIPFSDFVDIKDIVPDARVIIRARIEDIEAVIVNDKRIQVAVVIEVFVKVVVERVLKVVVDVVGPKGLEVVKEDLVVQTTKAVGERQFIVKETENLDDLLKPPFVQLIDVFTQVEIEEIRVLRDKVVFQGTVHVKVLYSTKTQQVVVLAEDIPFRDFVDLPGAEPGDTVELDVVVEHVTVQAEDRDNDGKKETITKTVVLQATARLLKRKAVKVVVDVRGIKGIDVTKQLVRVEELVGEQTAQVIVREVLDPKEMRKPCPVQIIDCRAYPRVTDLQAINDKVIVEGEVELKAIYESEAQAAHVMSAVFPFSTFADVPGVTPDDTPTATVSVVDVTCRLLDRFCPPIEVQAVLAVEIRVVVERQIKVVLAVFCPKKPVKFICPAVVTANKVNIRSGPGTEFPVIGQANLGDKVTILEEVGSWRRIKFGDLEGFMFGRFVRCLEPLG